MTVRAYIRLSPQVVEDKLEDGYSMAEIGAFLALLCAAEQQPERGRFKNLAWLKASLGPAARYIGLFVERKDLQVTRAGSYQVVHWDEWQEGDWKVAERVRRIREGRKSNGAQRDTDTADVTVPDVYTPSDGDRKAVAVSVSNSRSTAPARSTRSDDQTDGFQRVERAPLAQKLQEARGGGTPTASDATTPARARTAAAVQERDPDE